MLSVGCCMRIIFGDRSTSQDVCSSGIMTGVFFLVFYCSCFLVYGSWVSFQHWTLPALLVLYFP